ncbi:MAG: stimulus-sensing domain-containing protein, partial [Rhodospirillales bacterium]|nr:stimulus-sensing domain-containing protein [Rhodospirillales bacterium]
MGSVTVTGMRIWKPGKTLPGLSEDEGGRRRSLSPITRRILAVNILALAVLVIGLLYVGRYRQGLIASEVAALGAQAELFAAALGEAAVGAGQDLKGDPARPIVRRLAATAQVRARLIGAGGGLLADSRRMRGPGGAVDVEELPPPAAQQGLTRGFLGFFDKMFRFLRGQPMDGPPSGDAGREVGGLDETRRALAGETGFVLRGGQGGLSELSVAVPVQRYKRVLGALVLTRDTRKIDEAVYQVRLDILKMFGIALGVTVLLSIYLAGTIARPMRLLVQAADRVRHGHSRSYTLPDFRARKD